MYIYIYIYIYISSSQAWTPTRRNVLAQSTYVPLRISTNMTFKCIYFIGLEEKFPSEKKDSTNYTTPLLSTSEGVTLIACKCQKNMYKNYCIKGPKAQWLLPTHNMCELR
jgi:hypothetical protein